MTVARRKGDAGMADILFSRIVRARGRCQRCGTSTGPFDTAHIVRRRYSATRCHETNAWCLCRGCHRTVDGDPAEFMVLVERTVTRVVYEQLRRTAATGTGMSSKTWWRGQRAVLEERCRELGLSTRRAA